MFQLSIFFVFLLVCCESAKILGVFPTPAISHQVVFRPLMFELAKRGHEVTVVTTDPAFPKGQAPPNLTEIDLHDISYKYITKALIEDHENEKEQIRMLKGFNKFMINLVEMQIKSEEIQNYLRKNEKIDLLFIEACVRPAYIFAHIFKAPVIEFSSLAGFISTFDNFGAAVHPLYFPNVIQRKVNNLTLWEKMSNLYTHYLLKHIFAQHVSEENRMLMSIFGPNIPDLQDLKKNIEMLFLNVHPIWDFNRPVPPNVVYLGGLHQKEQKELPKELKSYLDSSKNGVIYISFGTNVIPLMFSPEKLKIFTDVFSKLPYDVLWKWDNDELPGRSHNVRISKWLPQSDLLRHPKIKLFITQGGLQSTDEAITAGVPLIGVPILGDQWFNVEQFVKFNIGKQLFMDKLSEKDLMDAIKTVIDDESYRQNIIKLRNIMNDQPQSPLERAVWWTEHVLRHGGGAHMRAPTAHLSWAEYYEAKVLLTLLGAVVLVISIIVLTIYFIFSKIKCYIRKKVKKN